MPDREKVITYLENEIFRAKQSVNDIWLECVEVKLLRDALALLKEQETMMQCIKGKCRICPHCANCDVDENGLLKEQEAKTGHWIDTTKVIGFPRCECSECNSEAGASWMKYCPNCGAKMEGR